ncbi:hypothetical protein CRG98_011146 [Punica granatum]|uniref:Integrase zinc-binding domain-containing protein n=1 Tax=Punica granatum TaxID=22663 RepID=A0A2I0KIV4_PUNGR|nr:hypothetical protein CRG98_011146 [Punica granatum]
MEEVHGGNCRPHMNGLMLAKKVMRLGYYWSTMETDCVKHVRHCHQCQVYADQIKALPNELRPMTAPWPFSMWGMDVIGPINPKASNGHLFILVAIDYFTKIQHCNSTPYRSQMNGAVEAANKNIEKIIEKMMVNYKDWHEMLPYALLAYRTSIRTSTGATPYPWILAEAELEEAEWAKQRYEQLNLIDEKRLKALCHGQCY